MLQVLIVHSVFCFNAFHLTYAEYYSFMAALGRFAGKNRNLYYIIKARGIGLLILQIKSYAAK